MLNLFLKSSYICCTSVSHLKRERNPSATAVLLVRGFAQSATKKSLTIENREAIAAGAAILGTISTAWVHRYQRTHRDETTCLCCQEGH